MELNISNHSNSGNNSGSGKVSPPVELEPHCIQGGYQGYPLLYNPRHHDNQEPIKSKHKQSGWKKLKSLNFSAINAPKFKYKFKHTLHRHSNQPWLRGDRRRTKSLGSREDLEICEDVEEACNRLGLVQIIL